MQKGLNDEKTCRSTPSGALGHMKEDEPVLDADESSSKTCTEKDLLGIIPWRLLVNLQDTYLWKGTG